MSVRRVAAWVMVIACLCGAYLAGSFEHGYSAANASCPKAVALANEGFGIWQDLLVALADARTAQNAGNEGSAQVAAARTNAQSQKLSEWQPRYDQARADCEAGK